MQSCDWHRLKSLRVFFVTLQSEDGADQDSPEEGTPTSPRNKRRAGRPGRKRKQLLPVSTMITGWRQLFLIYTAA